MRDCVAQSALHNKCSFALLSDWSRIRFVVQSRSNHLFADFQGVKKCE